jgi:hypothetical protein
MRTQRNHIATFIGLAIVLGGFVVIGLAWDGAAGENFVPAQFPYLISGGVTGIGLVILGLAIILVQTMRNDAVERDAQLARLEDRLTELQRVLSPPDEYDPSVSGEFRPRPRGADNGETPTKEVRTAGTWETAEKD